MSSAYTGNVNGNQGNCVEPRVSVSKQRIKANQRAKIHIRHKITALIIIKVTGTFQMKKLAMFCCLSICNPVCIGACLQ